MEIHLILPVLALLCLLTSTNAFLPTEQYWHAMLPNTPLPSYLQRQIQPTESSSNPQAYKPEINIAYPFGYKFYTKRDDGNGYDKLNETVFLLYEDMRTHTKLRPSFSKSNLDRGFIPRHQANSIPFSSDKMLDILNYFSVKPGSKAAELIKTTIFNCEAVKLKGEEKFCATSLESMVDFIAKKLGKNTRVITPDLQEGYKRQEYSIVAKPKLIGENIFVSHKLTYPYAVYYMHRLRGTQAYSVPMVGSDGAKIRPLIICHMDTSTWDKDHMSFKILKLLTNTNAFLPTEQYWHAMLPNTPLPSYLQRQIQPTESSSNPQAYKPEVNLAYLFGYKFYTERDDGNGYDKLNETVYFLYEDMRTHTKLRPSFSKSNLDRGFIPRHQANSIPFSSDKMLDIFNYFSVKPGSKGAELIKTTIFNCEAVKLEGEEKFCATSLESMVDFIAKKLGKNTRVITPDLQEGYKRQEYSIVAKPKLIGENIFVSHKLPYPYAVYFMHRLRGTQAYSVPMVGSDGAKIRPLIICHMDTSTWDKDHMSFKILKVKPGVPICHFPLTDFLVWIAN